MQFFVGIDVSLDSSRICVIDERGVIIKEGKADSDPAAIARFIRHKGRKIEHLGLETGSLPQLFNVIMGDMTLIGPRPYPPSECPDIGTSLPIISSITPGLTGL